MLILFVIFSIICTALWYLLGYWSWWFLLVAFLVLGGIIYLFDSIADGSFFEFFKSDEQKQKESKQREEANRKARKKLQQDLNIANQAASLKLKQQKIEYRERKNRGW